MVDFILKMQYSLKGSVSAMIESVTAFLSSVSVSEWFAKSETAILWLYSDYGMIPIPNYRNAIEKEYVI